MKAQVLLSLLLVCSLSGASSRLKTLKQDRKDAVSDVKVLGNAAKVYVFDDNHHPVLVNMETDDSESQEQTKKDLPNRVFFYLYTRRTGTKTAQQLKIDDTVALRRSDFNPRRQTVIVIHGWMNNYQSKVGTLVRDAYLKHGDYNVLVVDWGSITHRPYLWTSRRVLMVGQYVAQMIDFLAQHGLNPSLTTVVGHSLGAHVAGLSSHYAKRKVNYVVGMDPALPAFSNTNPGSRLAKGDANYVQVIHTDAGGLGFETTLGDADFFPNNGKAQKGCGVDIGGSCSHSRSYEYFAESINSAAGFLAVPCHNYAEFEHGACATRPSVRMGGPDPNFNVRGVFYLHTNSKAPYALGRQGLK